METKLIFTNHPWTISEARAIIEFKVLTSKYRLETKHEALRGFRNRGKAEVSKPRRAKGMVANRLRRRLVC